MAGSETLSLLKTIKLALNAGLSLQKPKARKSLGPILYQARQGPIPVRNLHKKIILVVLDLKARFGSILKT